jgi:hypothetical protein
MTCTHNTIGYCPFCDKPKRKRRDEHHEFQVALIEHLKLHEHLHPELELIHANPMGGKRPKRVGAKLKAEGAKAGIPDLFLPVPVNCGWQGSAGYGYPGLYIEIKVGEDDLSAAQKWWKPRLEAQGYCYYVARNMQDTIAFVLSYLRGEV